MKKPTYPEIIKGLKHDKLMLRDKLKDKQALIDKLRREIKYLTNKLNKEIK